MSHESTVKPMTVTWADARWGMAECKAWNDSRPAFEPGPIPDPKPAKANRTIGGVEGRAS